MGPLTSIPLQFNAYVHEIAAWSERHAGLGAWVGAAGAILAIFATWGLARAEYLRNKRQRRARKRSEIELMGKIISDFEALVKRYVTAAIAKDSAAIGFYHKHLNEAELHSMSDLAHIPVTSWPSLDAYASFKRYWFFALQVLETSNISPINVDDLRLKLEAHDYWLNHTNGALAEAARA